MSGTFTKDDRRLLGPFDQMYAQTTRTIRDLSDEDLAALRATCLHTSETNCGWSEYGVARFWLLPLIETDIKRRTSRRAVANQSVRPA